MSGGRPVPGPGASGPKQPQLVDKSTWQLSALLGSPLTPPTARPRPAHRLREAQQSQSLPGRTRRGAEGAGKMSPRGGGRGPQVLGRRPPAHAGWSPSSHVRGPFPPGRRRGPLLMASEHLPDTWGTPPRPSSAPQDPRGPATVPGSQAGQWPSHSPWTSRRGVVASTPQRLPLSILPKRQGQI